MSNRGVRILVATGGNEFMLDIAATLAEGMREAGVACELASDALPVRGSAIQIVVAPHEYCTLFLERRLHGDALREALETTYVLNVEQPGSEWFERSWHYARHASGVFDISSEGTSEFRRRGIDAVHAPLGLTGSPRLGPDMAERPVDVLFLGHVSPRRERFFARHAEFFSRRDCRLIFVDVARPRSSGSPGYVSSQTRTSLLLSSKILVNVHSSDRRYFESHRALLALSHGCALVTEASEGVGRLTNGQHFVMAPLADLADECERLLDDPVRLKAVGAAGYDFSATHLSMAATCRTILAHVDRAGGMTPNKSHNDLRNEVRNRLHASLAHRASGRVDWTTEDNALVSTVVTPRISVVVTCFNYGRYLEECLSSVARSQAVAGGCEVVIVDDGSTDGSDAYASKLIGATGVPTRLVLKETNTGLADARNVGIEIARGELVLTLDADNWLYPDCLRELADALSEQEVAAAYPILQRFQDGTNESLGLLSVYSWSPRELVRGPYIDALAMFRRDVLVSVGGYSTELIDYGWFGWEDYDLWLKVADAGHVCKQVPRILAAYRVRSDSMINQTNRSTGDLAVYFADKFLRLRRQYQELERQFGFPTPVSGGHPRTLAYPTDELTALRLHCANLEAERLAIYDSLSWRVTAPLRSTYRTLFGSRPARRPDR